MLNEIHPISGRQSLYAFPEPSNRLLIHSASHKHIFFEVFHRYLVTSLSYLSQLLCGYVLDEVWLDDTSKTCHEGVELLLDTVYDDVVDFLLGKSDELLEVFLVYCYLSTTWDKLQGLTYL